MRRNDAIVLERAYRYLEEYEFGIGLLEDSYRCKRYPRSHWWWYVDKIHRGELPKPDLSLPV